MKNEPSLIDAPAGEDTTTLTISPEKVCFIIVKAREFDAKDVVTEPDRDRFPPTTWMRRCSKITKTIPARRVEIGD